MRVLCIIEYMDGVGRPAKGNDRLIRGILELGKLCEFDLLMKPVLTGRISKGYTGLDLQWEYGPDVIILYGSFAGEVLSNFFKKMTCAKTVVITDFLGHINNNQGIMGAYKRNGFNVVFMRGAYPLKYESPVPMICVPFGVDGKEFYPDSLSIRVNRVGFAGTVGPSVYTTRRKAVKLLKKANLLRVCSKDQCNKGDVKKNKGYPLFLRSHVACLTSTEHYNWPADYRAKTFEIMASGTVLLTPWFLGIEEMLGKDGVHYVEYKKDCSDVVEKARQIIDNPEWARTIARNGLEVVLKKHTNEVRSRELYGHLTRLVEGRPIQRQYAWERAADEW